MFLKETKLLFLHSPILRNNHFFSFFLGYKLFNTVLALDPVNFMVFNSIWNVNDVLVYIYFYTKLREPYDISTNVRPIFPLGTFFIQVSHYVHVHT